jgi:geranylgeranyl reductase family protein
MKTRGLSQRVSMQRTRNPDMFDIVVVGGGPAGSSAAYTAVRAGLHVCVIDKSVFPREKLCGGLITPRTKRLFEKVFERTWKDGLVLSSDNVSFFSDNQYLASQNGYCELYFSMRRDFDAYLLSLAEAAGASLILGAGVHTLNSNGNTITLANGERIRYKVLIGSDGVSSLVAKTLFGSSFDHNTIGFGLEVEVPRELLPSRSNTVEIDFGAATWGYGWVFPKHRTFTIGVGGIHSQNSDLKDRLKTYLALKGLNISDFKVKGQYIPFGDYRKRPGRGNILLCGDAAGVVDPITGEGIAYAIQTGHAAAHAAAASLEKGMASTAIDLYAREYAQVAAAIRQADAWRYLIFPRILRRPFAWAFADAGTLQRGYLDILAGKHDYNALYKLFGLQVAKAARKLLRRTLGKLHLVSERSNDSRH